MQGDGKIFWQILNLVIFGQKYDFVLGEHKLKGDRPRNFSKNFNSSWK